MPHCLARAHSGLVQLDFELSPAGNIAKVCYTPRDSARCILVGFAFLPVYTLFLRGRVFNQSLTKLGMDVVPRTEAYSTFQCSRSTSYRNLARSIRSPCHITSNRAKTGRAAQRRTSYRVNAITAMQFDSEISSTLRGPSTGAGHPRPPYIRADRVRTEGTRGQRPMSSPRVTSSSQNHIAAAFPKPCQPRLHRRSPSSARPLAPARCRRRRVPRDQI